VCGRGRPGTTNKILRRGSNSAGINGDQVTDPAMKDSQVVLRLRIKLR